MTLLEKFNQVDLNGKMNLINEEGEFLVSCEYYNQKLNLYALPGFYAEVSYHPIEIRITKVEAITDPKKLNKYLPLIDLKII